MIPTDRLPTRPTDRSTDSVDRVTEPSRTNVRTDSRILGVSDERDGFPLSNAREIVGLIYIVNWPTARFTKVGFSAHNKRWRPFLRRGGELMGVLAEPYPQVTRLEHQMHAALVQAGAIPAFLRKADAAPYLGGGGGGWTECYIDRTGREVLGHLIQWAREKPRDATRMLRTRFGAIPCPNCNPAAEEAS